MDKDIKSALIIIGAFFMCLTIGAFYDMGVKHQMERQKIELLQKECG